MAWAVLPARVFISSRGPSSLIIGEVGEPITQDGSYAPDFAVFDKTFPLPPGPSAVKLAPIVDRHGTLALRVFIVCFESNEIIDYDPDQNIIEEVIHVGIGPFALAFDPFDLRDAALGKPGTVWRHASSPDAAPTRTTVTPAPASRGSPATAPTYANTV